MAEKTTSRKKSDVFWSKMNRNDSSDETSDAFVPGVSLPGNKRPSRLRSRKTREIHATIPKKQPLIETLSDSATSKNTSITTSRDISFAERSIQQLKKASLKDLRPEDKKRIADLIKELARVGEEREQAVNQLHGERENFEKQLLTLVEQQEKILQEREDIQTKLFKCQQLLTEYQAQILNKQDRINSSIADLKLAVRETSDSSLLTMSSPGCQIKITSPRQHGYEKGQASDLANQEVVYRTTNQNTDDIDIATATQNPSEGLKRPYTSLIDKEIARERSLSRSSRGSFESRSRSRSVSPNDGRPRFSYPNKLSGIGPLHEPVASSTHKSLEIRAQMSNDLDPDSPRSLVTAQPPDFERQTRGRVAFNERPETSEGAKQHSPNLKKGEIFKDPEYVNYYKQLTASGRKKELLKQRQLLLDEQERLRMILKEQEDQLKRKKLEYEKRQQLQKERMEFYEKGDKFPPLKLSFDVESDKGYGDNEEEEQRGIVLKRVNNDDNDDEDEMVTGKHTPQERVQIDDQVEIKSRISASTSPSRPSQQKVSMATSPLQTPRSQGSARSYDSDEGSVPKVIDVATSISYRTPLKDAGNRQGNLPLHSNRQRSDLGGKELSTPTPPVSARTPGEKTLNVIDLVNSMEEDQENNLEPITITPNKMRSSLGSRSENQSSSYRMIPSPAVYRHSPANYRTKRPGQEDEESLEENRILEDIFFL